MRFFKAAPGRALDQKKIFGPFRIKMKLLQGDKTPK
jgi:hypothetical protein